MEADQVKQARKRGETATMEDGATAAVESTNADGDGSVAELRLSLAGLMQGQEKLRELVNINFVRQSTNLAAMIANRLVTFRAEIDGHMWEPCTKTYRPCTAVLRRYRYIENSDLRPWQITTSTWSIGAQML